MNSLGQLRLRRGLIVVGLLLALASVFGVGTASADPLAVNTSPPVISGTAQSRLTLTAAPGSWSGNTSGGFSYQWQRCNAAGANCNPIFGATNPTYTTNDGDIGATIVVEVTALDGPAVAASAATAVVRYPAPYGGTCSLVPNYGDAGATVFTITCQGWSDYFQQNPLTYMFQWWGCDGAGENCVLEHENPPTTVPRGEGVLSGFLSGYVDYGYTGSIDRGAVVICQHNGGCTTWSDLIYLADEGQPHINPLALPTISGDAWLGETLSADPGEWSGDPTISYQWLRCASTSPHAWWEPWEWYNDCAPIDDATEATYTVQPSDYGSSFIVEVTATNAQGTTVTSSAATSYVVQELTLTDLHDGDHLWGQFDIDWTIANNRAPIDHYELFVNGKDIGSTDADSPSYGFDDNGVLDYGANTVKVVAHETNGDTFESQQVSFVYGPTLTMTAPGDGVTLARGATVELRWAVEDPSAIDHYDILVEDVPFGVSVDGSATGYLLDTTSLADGPNSVQVRAVDGQGRIFPSDPITIVAGGHAPSNTTPGVIGGTPRIGSAVGVDNGTWDAIPVPASYTYQWARCDDDHNCTAIDGATGSTYTPQPSDLGSKLAVVETATNQFGTSEPVYSRLSDPVTLALSPPSGTVTISGSPVAGTVLTAQIVGLGGYPLAQPGDMHFSWWDCEYTVAHFGFGSCHRASNSGAQYRLQGSDRGWYMEVFVDVSTAAGTRGFSAVLTDPVGDPVAPSNTGQPQIDTSAPLVGTQVSASTGAWTGAPAPGGGDFSYQWYRCVDGCTAIGGATRQTYTPVEADFGHQLAVVVTARTIGGSASSNLSSAVLTDPVAHADVRASIDSGPDDLTASDSATFTFSSPQEPNVHFRCYLDGVDTGSCSSPATYPDLAEGDHSFSVHATDALGLESGVNPTDPVREWTVDTTAPVVTVDSAPSGSESATDASFSFHADDPAASFECKLDDGAWTPCASPRGYGSLALGGHTFRVRATDAAANVSAPDDVTWTVVDRTAPVVTVDSAPSGSDSATDASFSFHADDLAASFECKLDDGAWTACASPLSYSSLALGGHTFQVRATDAAENVSALVRATWAVIAAPSNDPTPTPTPAPTPTPTPTLKVIPTRPKETSTPRSTKPGALPPVTAPEFSTSPTVQLAIAAPAGATQIVISNQPDFTGARSFPVSADGLYTWTVLSDGTPNGERTVYVKFVTPQGDSGTLTTNVKLDDKAPVVSKPRYVDEAKGGTPGQSRVYLNVPATDPASQLRYMQFASDRKHPWSWTTYTQRQSVRTKHHFIWVRTADGAGNVSGWLKIIFPKTPIKHPRG